MTQAQIVQRDALEQSAQPNFLHQEQQILQSRLQEAEKGQSKFLPASGNITAVEMVTGSKNQVINASLHIADDASSSSTKSRFDPWISTSTGKKGKAPSKYFNFEKASYTQQRNGLGMEMNYTEKKGALKKALKQGLVAPAGSARYSLSYSDVNNTSMSVSGISYSGAHTTAFHANMNVSGSAATGVYHVVQETKRQLADIQDIRDVNPTTANLVYGAQQGDAKAENVLDTKAGNGDEKARQAEEILAQQAKAQGKLVTPQQPGQKKKQSN